MKFLTKQYDERIKATNILIELTGEEYIRVANGILENNEFQRRRVKSSGTVYSLLKDDITKGCLIPPLVLATINSIDYHDINEDTIISEILNDSNKLIILDGLQRTYLLIDIAKQNQDFDLSKITLRIEIYINITEVAILYRMLTLNTGQTPMSLRHQIEILYSHYLVDGIDDIKIIRQTDKEIKRKIDEYNFSDLIEGYNSYIERNELPLDKFNLLDTVKNIENLAKEEDRDDDFSSFVKLYHNLVLKIVQESNGWEYPNSDERIPEEYKLGSIPFGTVPYKILNKSQSLSGFGAAVGKLIDFKTISNFSELNELIKNVIIDDENATFFTILKRLDEIRNDSKKIGNSQRLFFHHVFRGLFDKENDCYLNFNKSVEYGYNRYRSQN